MEGEQGSEPDHSFTLANERTVLGSHSIGDPC
jgi:uncharacterized membrane protein YidH (DUF202 family)